MLDRRSFLKSFSAAAIGASLRPSLAMGAGETRLVILHTNDTHSRIDPFPMDGGRNQGLGGVARRAALIQQIRSCNDHVLLLDSGDIFQGTPYFNLFNGEIDFRVMSEMKYDVVTLGNHDFDNGVSGLMDVIDYADFEFVSANYRVAGTPLGDHVTPYTIRRIDGITVGIFGLGISFEGLVLPSLHRGVSYEDPISVSREILQELRGQGCDLVIALSHLGHRYREPDRPSELSLARAVPGIDLILGGHTHTFMDQPEVVEHFDGSKTVIHQVGWAGIRLGRIDVVFDRHSELIGYYGGSIPVDRRIELADDHSAG